MAKMAKSFFIFLFFFFLFTFGLTTQGRSVGKYHMIFYMSHVRVMSHDESHDEYRKVVYRPCSSCISTVQKLNKNSIEFSLSTQTRSVVKSS